MTSIDSFDISILEYVMNNIRKDWLDPIVIFITHLGKAGIAWILLIMVLLVIKKTRRVGIACAMALVINVILCNFIIKPLIARPRPYDLYEQIICIVKPQWDYSFPSGHTWSGISSALIILMDNRRRGIAAMIMAVVIAFSRLYLYVHFPSDVLAGAVFGVLMALLTEKIVEKYLPKMPAKVTAFFDGDQEAGKAA